MPARWVWDIAARVYRSRLAARLLFGVRVSPIGPQDHYFDVTSWVLLRHALAETGPTTRVVDLGAGSQAILGLALWRRRGCSVTSIDINPEVLEQARATVARNRAENEVFLLHSRLLDELPEPFDLVVFNPPYVPSEAGRQHDLPLSRRSQWDGGADGLDTVRAFAAAIAARPHPLRFCLGVNTVHVSAPALRELLELAPGISVEREEGFPGLPVSVFIGHAGTVKSARAESA